jgi:hypothetical protein
MCTNCELLKKREALSDQGWVWGGKGQFGDLVHIHTQIFIWERFCYVTQAALISRLSCLRLLSAGIIGMLYHAQFLKSF